MQQLQNASDPDVCARSLLEAVIEVMVTVRESKARRHGGGPTLIHMRAMGVVRKRPGATLSTVADQLALTLSATSRLVDVLVAKGMVKRVIPEGNRRTVSLMLTPAGNKVLEKMIRETEQDLAAFLKKMPAKRRAVLRGCMVELLAVMGAAEKTNHEGAKNTKTHEEG